ncbi:MAG: hypothetical protein AB7W47_15965 [Calditrichaceae bacterium]
MRNTILILLFPAVVLAQYWGERANEKSFEQSSLYFNSYYLNTFGIYQFRDVAVGLIDDPFLNMHLNPARFKSDTLANTLMYMDFRGDRKVIEATQYYPYPLYYDDYYYRNYIIDPRWYTTTRSEPEPVFSFGMITFPAGKNLYIGGSYQLIYKKEPYYQVPTWIYNTRYGYDAFGEKVDTGTEIPVVDRYAGEDEMLTTAHMISGSIGYRLSEAIRLGINVNSVAHDRDGLYLNVNSDEYSTSGGSDWYNAYSTDRDQEYSHIDINGGLLYQLSPKVNIGIKAGILDGNVKQSLNRTDSSHYNYDYTYDDRTDFSNSFSSGITSQNWEHDGQSKYGNISLNYEMTPGNHLKIYYQHENKDIDLTNSSVINDTSFYASSYSWDTTRVTNLYWSSVKDIRDATGKNDITINRGMFSFSLKASPKSTVSFGFYFSNTESRTNTVEPVSVIRDSESKYYYTYNELFTPDTSHYIYYVEEDKRLTWKYESSLKTMQIPVVLNYMIAENWNLMLGVNRILNSWEIKEETIAYFNLRKKNENGITGEETNFIERYREPTKNYTENETDFMAGLNVKVSPKFTINILVDPESEPDWRISQWWLSFSAKL